MNEHIVIEDKALQSRFSAYSWGTVTLALWALFFSLWQPLISLVAWWLGYKTFYIHMIEEKGGTHLFNNFSFYVIFIVILAGALIGWAEIERYRFKNKKRRHAMAPIDQQKVANYYQLPKETLSKATNSKIVVAQFDDEGKVINFEAQP